MSDNDHSSGQPQPRAGHSFVEPASAAREMPTLLSGDMRREAERQAWQKEEEAVSGRRQLKEQRGRSLTR